MPPSNLAAEGGAGIGQTNVSLSQQERISAMSGSSNAIEESISVGTGSGATVGEVQQHHSTTNSNSQISETGGSSITAAGRSASSQQEESVAEEQAEEEDSYGSDRFEQVTPAPGDSPPPPKSEPSQGSVASSARAGRQHAAPAAQASSLAASANEQDADVAEREASYHQRYMAMIQTRDQFGSRSASPHGSGAPSPTAASAAAAAAATATTIARSRAGSARGDAVRPGTADDVGWAELMASTKSVHSQALDRMAKTTDGMSVAPLSPSLVRSPMPPSSQGTRPHTVADTSPTTQLSSTWPRQELRASISRPHSGAKKLLQDLQPFRKMYSPGPGAYETESGRFGSRRAVSCSFGSARQRPPHVCINTIDSSPGPVYKCSHDMLSTSFNQPRTKFGRQAPGSRFVANAEQASNKPCFNPGPGLYEVAVTAKGAPVQSGSDAPAWHFPKTAKLAEFSKSPFVSESHSRTANFGSHSPGPSNYDVVHSQVESDSCRFTMAPKAPSYFDVCADQSRLISPLGPGTNAGGELDRTSHRTFEPTPHAIFPRAAKEWAPAINLAASQFLSKEHARVANASIHSPGPKYLPSHDAVFSKVYGTVLSSGPADRFYSRFELGRIN